VSAGSSAGETYDRLWAAASDYFRDGRVEIDPYLNDRRNDRRLGFTVIGRPDRAACEQFAAFLDQVRQVAPRQYYYQASDFHLTVLSLFTATTAFEPHWNNLAAYRAAVAHALMGARPFTIGYQGITASKNAIIIQGFPQDRQLDQLRDSLRQSLRAAGVGEGLDRRYIIGTAHSTVLRFASQPEDLSGLLVVLRKNRLTDFGQTTFRELQLVKNDWYMSQAIVEILARYPLPDSR
jgi:2'-5' RNA ligase